MSDKDTMNEENPVEKDNSKDPVRKITLSVLGFCVFLFIWYISADRLAPWTDQARVQAFIVPIAPQVSGKVRMVNVVQDQVTQTGDLLLEIDPKEYELALQTAESNLELAGQEVGANTEAVVAAQAKVSEAQAQVLFSRKQSKRYRALAKKGILSKAEADEVTAKVSQSKAQLANAKASLEKAKQQLGKKDRENPKFKSALAALEKAQIDLAETKIYAPSSGVITNLKIAEGHYAQTGAPLMTFISAENIWVTAYMRENNISNIKPGNEVDIVLDIAPGSIFSGEVVSIGYGVNQSSGGKVGELETIETESGWLRNAQRFPVIIKFTDDNSRGFRRHGGRADVQVYTGSHWILNSLGWLWIRFMSFTSYVY